MRVCHEKVSQDYHMHISLLIRLLRFIFFNSPLSFLPFTTIFYKTIMIEKLRGYLL